MDSGAGLLANPVIGVLADRTTSPLMVAPLLAGVLIGLMNSYTALFALAGLAPVIAAWTVGRARSAPRLAFTKSISNGILVSRRHKVEAPL